MSRLTVAMLAAAMTATAGAAAAEEARPRQTVLISFDGALYNEQWERSRALARETGARFTYFLSCTYLLTRETRSTYAPPRHAAGASNVGFGFSRDDVAERLRHLWEAGSEGHEVASHGCGHFDGGDWSAAEWQQEFAEFDRIVADAWRINGIDGEPDGWRAYAERFGNGFRAPYLSAGEGLWRALARQGAAYDASTVSRQPARPDGSGTVVRFALPMIAEGPEARPVLAMDYNLFVRHSGGFERGDEDGEFEERAYRAFRNAFDAQYGGNRVPLQIGFHFTLMNGGAYWNALERFVRETCTRDDVDCIPYREALRDESAS